MTLFSAVLFVHIVAMLGLCVALSFEAVGLARLRKSANFADMRAWIDPVPSLPFVAIGSILLLLASGIYLTVQLQAWSLAWPKVAFLTLLLISPLGAITGSRMRAVRQLIRKGDAADYSALQQRLGDRFLSLSLRVRFAVVLGIVLIMAAKPSLYACLIIVALSALVGVLFTFPTRRRSIPAQATGRS